MLINKIIILDVNCLVSSDGRAMAYQFLQYRVIRPDLSCATESGSSESLGDIVFFNSCCMLVNEVSLKKYFLNIYLFYTSTIKEKNRKVKF